MAEPGPSAPGPPPVDLRLYPAAGATWVAAAFAVGRPPAHSAWLGLALLLVATAAVGAAARRVRRRRHRALGDLRTGAVVALFAAALASGVVAAAAGAREASHLGVLTRAGATAQVEAVVLGEPRGVAPRSEGSATPRVRVLLEVREVVGRGRGASARAPVLLLGPAGWACVEVGERVGVIGRLAPVDRGEEVLALLVTTREPRILDDGGPVRVAVAEMRAGLLRVSGRLPADAAGLVPGIAIGDTSRIPADLTQAMRVASLTHLTAVSGAHVAIVLGTVLAVTTGLARPGRAGLAAIVLAGFVVLVHPAPSVLRAAVMGAVAVAGILAGRAARAAPALAVAVLVLVLLDPWAARSFGFALSVLATGGIILLAPPLIRALARRVPRALAHAIAIPAAAQAACGPVVVLLDPALPLLAVPANLAAAPAVPAATVLGVLATLIGPASEPAAGLLATGAGWAASWIAGVARVVAAVPGARLAWPGGLPGALLMLLATVGAALALVRAGRRGPAHGTWRPGLAAGLAVLLVALPGPRAVLGRLTPWAWPPPGWAVAACDVGQGTALVVRSGSDAAVLVDTGPPGDAARRCLDALGIRRLDLLVLTHLHADHVGGLPGVLAGRSVAAALVTSYPEPAAARRAVADALARSAVPVATPEAPGGPASAASDPTAGGQAGTVRWDVLAPTARAVDLASGTDGTTLNDLSLVVLLRRPDLAVLALGDLETEAQARLADRVAHARARDPATAAALPRVDVVVVAHHGSARQDPRLAELISAPVAMVSAGAGNEYGHPAPSALALYGRAGALVLRTDLCGTIAVVPAPLTAVSGCPTVVGG